MMGRGEGCLCPFAHPYIMAPHYHDCLSACLNVLTRVPGTPIGVTRLGSPASPRIVPVDEAACRALLLLWSLRRVGKELKWAQLRKRSRGPSKRLVLEKGPRRVEKEPGGVRARAANLRRAVCTTHTTQHWHYACSTSVFISVTISTLPQCLHL